MRKLGIICASLAIACAATAAPAEDFPTRPVRILVGFGPGSAADITARIVANRMSQIGGQQFVVENRTGAGSSVAAAEVARAPKDGYTLFIGTAANVANAVISQQLPFDFGKDLAPVSLLTSLPVILVATPSLGVSTVAELVTLAKSKPGEITYASTGVGTSPHLTAELFSQRAGVKLVHVPYQGSPQAATDLIAGRIGVMFSPATAVTSLIDSGKLKGLAVAAPRRVAIAPNLPTTAEAGLPDFDTSIWFGLMAPAGTPDSVINKIASLANEALKSDEVRDGLKKQGFELHSGSPADFGRHIANDIQRWTDAAKAAGLKK